MSSIKDLVLLSYYYSSASWRVRAVLAHKKLPFKYEPVNLLKGVQHSADYSRINPLNQVPALTVVGTDGSINVISQSLAIIEFLEENYPDQSIFPKDAMLRAKSRAIADTISGGIQPLQNLETQVKYKEALGLGDTSPEERKKVAQYWLNSKLGKLEALVKKTSGQYCVGDEVSLADICLVPQMFNARRYEIDIDQFPTLKSIDERCQELEIFKVSHPLACPDNPNK